ncbi:MAG TPA: sterol desaturase family protein [Smithella sp.]|nr:sterol desaturase family protein [Smithella sp.]
MFNTVLNFVLNMSKTRANYWGEFAVDIPLGIALIFMGLRRNDLNMPVVFLFVISGLFFFSFFEYFIHRWLFHGRIQVMARGHRLHHLNPAGYDSLPFFLPAIILLTLTGIFVLLIPANRAFVLTGTMTFGYVIYGLSHFAIHHVRFKTRLVRHWSARHLIHHQHPRYNFGVTTPLWDVLLGTPYIYNRKI